MIKVDYLEINEKQFTYTYSDEHRYVVRDGIEYEEAYDPAEFGRVYTEGDLIPQEDEPVEEE